MILGIGVDIVSVKRFESWHTYAPKKLARFFSPQEIDYCLEYPQKSAERFAVRFAAKEALFKALCQAYPEKKFTLWAVLRASTVYKLNNVPGIVVNWNRLGISLSCIVLVSLAHTQETAIAYLILQNHPAECLKELLG